jgi:hypothetical protein
MKIKHITYSLLSLVVGLSSCISDDSEGAYVVVPSLGIEANDTTPMPVKNFNLGDEAVITPNISYSGDDDLTYTWYVGTYKDGVKGEMEEVSNAKMFNYRFVAGGSYYAHLTVTDGRVGAARDYRINIRRTFEEGYILVSNDANGKGNLAFIKTMTPEEIAAGEKQVYMEHIIERMNDGITVNNLRGAMHGIITWPKVIHRIIASTADNCYFFDPNSFTIASSIRYADVVDGFKASGFYIDFYPFAYDASKKKFIHLNQEYMFGYEYGFFQGHSFEDLFQSSYAAFGSVYHANFYVDYSTSMVKVLNMNTGMFNGTGERLAQEDIISCFLSPVQGYMRSDRVLTHSKDDPSQWYLHDYDGIAYLEDDDNGKTTNFTVTANTAIPAQGTRFALSEPNNRYFYPVGNHIYVFLPASSQPMPDKDQWAVEMPEGELITYMNVNAETDELYVATVTTSSGRGNFYIYNSADIKTDNQGRVRPVASHKDVADRISNIFYKPSL